MLNNMYVAKKIQNKISKNLNKHKLNRKKAV